MNMRGRPVKYPWAIMEIDDTFVSEASLASTRAMASRAGRKYGRKFKVGMARNVLDTENSYVQVKRVA